MWPPGGRGDGGQLQAVAAAFAHQRGARRDARACREPGDRRLPRQPGGPAPPGPARPGAGDGARPRLPHRLQARGGRRHRPRGGDRRHPPRAAAARRGGLGAHHPAPRRAARRAGDRHRQRHRRARDRGVHPQSHPGSGGREAAQGGGRHRAGDRRLGLLGLLGRPRGAAAARRHPARCGLDRPPAARPARRAGEDRAALDGRRPVPARRGPEVAGARAGHRRRRRCEPGRRGAEHRLRAAAAPGLRPLRAPRPGDRRVPRRQRRILLPAGSAQGDRLRPQDVRAGRRIPARARRRPSAGQHGGPPGAL